jgi:hypothetical protein
MKARSSIGVPPRLSPQGIIPSQRLSFRPGFLGRGLNGRYVSVTIDQYPDLSSDRIDVGMVFENRGQTPAFKMRNWLLMTTDDNPMRESVFEDGKKFFERQDETESILFPGAKFKAQTAAGMDQFGYSAVLPEEEKNRIRRGWRTMWVFGQIDYRDAFGKDRFTRFRLFMTGEYMTRIGKLFWAAQGNCTDEDCPQ